ncbi:response regulator [Fusobacterium sp.]|uniref:response regulator transcription factor n=1 Tax=Fusobacterium sp. TaxID=68766 RepID=UPI00263A3D2A|nr:response regulator [Fusobacterium sp.]
MIKVLIVEDEEIIRKGLIGTIDWESKGCTIIGEAINGLDGMEKIIQNFPDLVITDIKMPKMSGLEMVKECYLRGIRFETILLTSYGEFEYAKEGINLGVIDYILKPLDEELLYSALDKVKQRVEEQKNLKKITGNEEEKNSFFDIDSHIEKARAQNKYVYKALKNIKENYSKKMNIVDVSEELEVSSGYLSRKFKEELDETFLEIVNKYRVEKSIKLLLEQELKMYEISDRVGFTDYKHFCNVFKKYMGVAPGEFIKNEVSK